MIAPFELLRVSTSLFPGGRSYYTLVEDWSAKRDIVVVMCQDLPEIVRAHENTAKTPYENDPRYSLSDPIPKVRLMAAVESTVSALYGLADVAASFAAKVAGQLPASFNKLSKQVAQGKVDNALVETMGDVSWYQRVREIRTEFTHHSTVFVGKRDAETIFVVRDYRRVGDKVHFKETAQVTAPELIDWTHKAIRSMDALAGYLAENFVLPRFDPDEIFTTVVRDENGFPILKKEQARFETRQITVRQYFTEYGIDLDSYRPAGASRRSQSAEPGDPLA